MAAVFSAPSTRVLPPSPPFCVAVLLCRAGRLAVAPRRARVCVRVVVVYLYHFVLRTREGAVALPRQDRAVFGFFALQLPVASRGAACASALSADALRWCIVVQIPMFVNKITSSKTQLPYRCATRRHRPVFRSSFDSRRCCARQLAT